MSTISWSPDRHPNYIRLNACDKMLVRTKPTPSGRILYQFGDHCDYVATVEEAKEMVEGLFVSQGRPT